jgi:small subunit ribosomal protein S1
MPGVEGLVHISELAQHHVENPREIVSQGDLVEAKIIEVDAERRRLSLSLKRVEGGGVTQRADDSEPVEGTPALDLSEEVFPEGAAEAPPLEGADELAVEPAADAEPAAEAETEPAAEAETEPAAEGEAEPVAEIVEEEAPAPAEEPAVEDADASIEADQVAPEEQGPGDSDGEPPAAPE